MKREEVGSIETAISEDDGAGSELLKALIRSGPAATTAMDGPQAAGSTGAGVTIGRLVAIADGGRDPLVIFAGQPGTGALRARATVDVHAAHIGAEVVLMFEGADLARPILLGVLRKDHGWPLPEQPGQVEVEADGERLLVQAKEQLVLRCGKASIRLTRAGKVLIEGSYVLSRSSGANRIKGGSVQLN